MTKHTEPIPYEFNDYYNHSKDMLALIIQEWMEHAWKNHWTYSGLSQYQVFALLKDIVAWLEEVKS